MNISPNTLLNRFKHSESIQCGTSESIQNESKSVHCDADESIQYGTESILPGLG